jgi:hypothetical protein
MGLGGWLRSLGLEQYEAAFRENAIDEKLLPRLTAEDLKDLGVILVGHRRLLLDAIAALRAEPTAEAPPPDAPPATDIATECRQVTVMFSDLVGSTALAARMDPEDLREVIAAYQKCVAETVRGFDEFVAKYLGVADLNASLIVGKGGRPKKPTTIVTDTGRIEWHIIPLIGARRVKDLTKADINKVLKDIMARKTRVSVKAKKLRGKAIVRGGAWPAISNCVEIINDVRRGWYPLLHG